MGKNSETDDQFFDTWDEITSVSDLCSDCSEDCSGCVPKGFGYDFWIKSPKSVQERRDKFLKLMGLDVDWLRNEQEQSGDTLFDEIKLDTDRINQFSDGTQDGYMSECGDGYKSSHPLMSYWVNEYYGLTEDGSLEDHLMCTFRNLDDGTEFLADECGEDGTLTRLHQVCSNRMVTAEEFQRSFGSSSFVQQFLRRELEIDTIVESKKKVKRKGWLPKLSIGSCIVDRQRGVNLPANGINLNNLQSDQINSKVTPGVPRLHARSHEKRLKELSSLFTGQEFPAHKGSILTMKFSPDGHYLASSGKDGVVRVWKVIEHERPNTCSIQDSDPSSLYFSLNQFSELAPLDLNEDKTKRSRKSSKSAHALLPPKVFCMLEKPLHEFYGHSSEVLALSWSKTGSLLSSSVDGTVRLWQLGQDQCLEVFRHNNYVTCVEFNPVDDNHFISGSIDGKVRIWEVRSCRVVDWTDIREIVTALCYCPNGKGAIVGSMDGNCRFFDIIDNQLQLGAQINLLGKKKLPGKKITGFQFSPIDQSKVIVTSADSQVQLLSGSNVICKFKGSRNSAGQISACFTSDGKHIVSASEGSNVYIWNYINQDQSSSQAKTISSYESFLSHNALIAIPWCGMKSISETFTSPRVSGDDLPGSKVENGHHLKEDSQEKLHFSSPDFFSMSRRFLTESMHWGSATWPEEKLLKSSPVAVSPSMRKSKYKFLRNACQSTLMSPHMWGLVIVTAGWDGWIRTYLNYGLPIRF